MNNQNNMISFITLTDLEADKIELNPAFIVMMKRDTYMPEEGVEMPFTKLYLTSGHHVWCVETPEEIAQLQIDSLASVMNSVFSIAEEIAGDI